MAGVVGNTDKHMDVVGVDTCMVVVVTHSAEVSGCTTNTVQLSQVQTESLVGCLKLLESVKTLLTNS